MSGVRPAAQESVGRREEVSGQPEFPAKNSSGRRPARVLPPRQTAYRGCWRQRPDFSVTLFPPRSCYLDIPSRFLCFQQDGSCMDP